MKTFKMAGYLIYHPERKKTPFGNLVVYHDSTTGNQDPYIWNHPFLHTYCHITQMSPEVGHINFWFSGDTFPEFNELYCDLVFTVQKKVLWTETNSIDRDDPIVESAEAYNDHYQWACQHHFKRRRRFTLKADPLRSFQPQTEEKKLMDIVPFLTELGIPLKTLRKELRAGYASRPRPLDNHVANALYEHLQQAATTKLRGDILVKVRKEHSELASPRCARSACR
jgi:hypothetical protein